MTTNHVTKKAYDEATAKAAALARKAYSEAIASWKAYDEAIAGSTPTPTD